MAPRMAATSANGPDCRSANTKVDPDGETVGQGAPDTAGRTGDHGAGERYSRCGVISLPRDRRRFPLSPRYQPGRHRIRCSRRPGRSRVTMRVRDSYARASAVLAMVIPCSLSR